MTDFKFNAVPTGFLEPDYFTVSLNHIKTKVAINATFVFGAGNQIRTGTRSLEGCCATITPYPRALENLEQNSGKLVGEEGFEPPTPRSQSECATRLRYSPKNSLGSIQGLFECGNPGKWRSVVARVTAWVEGALL